MKNAAPRVEWIETEAVVTACSFQFARLNTLRLGLQTGEKFRIAFVYYALAGQYTDEFQSPVAVPQGERIHISYNPTNPQQNSRTHRRSLPSARGSLMSVGIAGSIVLSLLWLTVLRGCR